MKKNAIIIAGILFAGGAASNQAQNRDSSQPYDSDRSAEFRADSSIRGGSNEARGRARQNLDREPAGHPMNRAFQADSSIRGGWRMDREGEYEPSSNTRNERFKADSSIRGGSNEARYPFRLRADGESDLSHNSLRLDRQGETLSEPNWNPSDDLLQDEMMTHEQRGFSQFNNDASVGGAVRSESSSVSTTSPLDDMDVDLSVHDSGVGAAASSEIGSSSSSSKLEQDLNSSSNLESNITGEYNLDANRDADRPASGDYPVRLNDPSSGELEIDRFDSSTESKESDNSELSHQSISQGRGLEASGAAASSETGSNSSLTPQYSETLVPSDLDQPGQTGYSLFRNNRAQGVGSAAVGEFGGTASTTDLANRVKATLTRESTGSDGLMPHDVARNVQVTSNGGGTVTLKGAVSSQKYKDMIEIRAREIRGVTRVDNQLMVTPQADSTLRDISIGRDLEDATDQLQNIERIEN